MGFFSLLSDVVSDTSADLKKLVATNDSKIVEQQETAHKRSREYASTYKSFNKTMEEYKIKKLSKMLIDLNSDSDSTIGTSNSSLMGASDYKGPDATTTKIPGQNGPYKSGIKAKLKNTDKYDEYILKYAKENKIDPMLCKIIILMESGGEPGVTSYDGAGSRGLTQITPGNVGVDVDANKLFEPEYNIKMFYEAAKGKASISQSRYGNASVKNVALCWNGAGKWAIAYSNAFAEIYKGFGLNPDNNYKTLSGIKSSSNGDVGGSEGWVNPLHDISYTVTQEWDQIGYGTGQIHGGIDMAPIGSAPPIYAAKKGKVLQVVPNHSIGGNYVVIQHDGSYWTYYGHLANINVSEGQSVGTDTNLGQCGKTGLATGVHLHFEVWKNAKWSRINPRSVISVK